MNYKPKISEKLKNKEILYSKIFFFAVLLPAIQYIVYILTLVPFSVFQTFIVNLEA